MPRAICGCALALRDQEATEPDPIQTSLVSGRGDPLPSGLAWKAARFSGWPPFSYSACMIQNNLPAIPGFVEEQSKYSGRFSAGVRPAIEMESSDHGCVISS